MCRIRAGGRGRTLFLCKNQALRAAARLLRSNRRRVAVAVGGNNPQWELDHKGQKDDKEKSARKDHEKVNEGQDRRKVGQDEVKLYQKMQGPTAKTMFTWPMLDPVMSDGQSDRARSEVPGRDQLSTRRQGTTMARVGPRAGVTSAR